MKYALILVILFANYGCDNAYPKEEKPKEIVVHDTVFIKPPTAKDELMGTVKGLLIDYYQAGYMDAQNAMIELYNTDKFTNETVEKQRFSHFRKIEVKVNSKK